MKRSYLLVGLALTILLISVFILKPKENPSWVNELIIEKQSGPVENPPASITRCKFKEQTVYFLPDRCCDTPSMLFDEKGDYMCAPGGGITGLGDDRCPDFFEKRESCEVLWEDTRTHS